MEKLNQKCERNKIETQQKFAQKNKNTEIRHEKNVEEMNIKNEQLKKEAEEKEFKKYCVVYWLRKEREKNMVKKKKEQSDKLAEKAEKLEELERNNEKKRKELIKRIKAMEKKKLEHDKEKEKLILENRMRQEAKFQRTKENLENLKEEKAENRQEILDYQNSFLGRGVNKDNVTNLKRLNAIESTITDQMNLEKNLRAFNRQMNVLKSQSVYKISEEKRYQLYKDRKRAEAERRKKEEEEKRLAQEK